MPTIEERVAEAESTIQKLHEDITELQARRSSIHNDINAQLKEAHEQSDAKHAARMAQLERENNKTKVTLDARQKYLDEYMIRLDAQAATQAETAKVIATKEFVIAKATEEFGNDKRLALKELDSKNAQAASTLRTANDRLAAAILKEADNVKTDTDLNGRELSAAAAADGVKDLTLALDKTKAENADILRQNDEKLASIKEESALIREVLDDIEKKKQELIDLSVFKDDIAALEKEKAIFEAKKLQQAEFSKNVEARDVAVREKEQTVKEQQRYLTIKDREVSGKISLLGKIRKGEST